MVGFREPVQVGYEAVQFLHFVDNVVGCAFRRLESVAQRFRFQLDDAEGRVQLVGNIVDQPAAELALSFQGGGHPVEGRTHLAQLV